MYDIITTGADKMNNKERYIRYANKNFKGKARKLVINQIELFYDSSNISKNHYNVGDEVYLKKGTFLHGLGLNPNSLSYTFHRINAISFCDELLRSCEASLR